MRVLVFEEALKNDRNAVLHFNGNFVESGQGSLSALRSDSFGGSLSSDTLVELLSSSPATV